MEMEIGARLREARESSGMSLEEVQNTTKIQKRYLQAIEGNEFHILPGKFYTRAFIREYASAVGLDPEVVMEEHKGELPKFEDEEMVRYSRVQTSKQQTSRKSSGASKLFPTILTVGIIVALVFVFYLFIQGNNNGNTETPEGQSASQDEVNAPVEEEPANTSAEEPSEDEMEDSATNTKDQPVDDQPEQPEEPQVTIELAKQGTGGFPEHVYTITGTKERTATIELTGDAYLQVQAPKGSENLIAPIVYGVEDSPITLDFTGQNQLYIKTGSAPSTVVKVNGEIIPFPDPELSTQKLLLNFK